MQTAPLDKYRHYKNGKTYEVIDIALHSETHEEMVVYKAMYHSDDFGLNRSWVRPKKMFLKHVEHEGKTVPRFTRLEED